jgi:predicted TIM-barrel fold metal-dependent hydrolase
MTVIAIEEHWNLPELTSAVRALPDDRGDESIVLDELGDNLERLDDIGEARIAAMDAQGIDVQILSLAPPGTQPLDPADALPIAMRANDIAAEAVRRHPARFRAFATLPMADARRAAAELERTAGLGFVGAMVYGRTGATPLDDPRYDDLFAAAAASGQPIVIHELGNAQPDAARSDDARPAAVLDGLSLPAAEQGRHRPVRHRIPHRRGPGAVHGGQRTSAFRHHELTRSSWDRAKLSVSPRAPPIHTSWHA